MFIIDSSSISFSIRRLLFALSSYFLPLHIFKSRRQKTDLMTQLLDLTSFQIPKSVTSKAETNTSANPNGSRRLQRTHGF